MKTRLSHLWDNLNSSYWFIPAAMVAATVVLAFFTLWIDRHWTAPKVSAWIYTGGAAGARALLSTVAGSVITVAGVVFSITIATLTQASSQFGPRLLRNFMRDTGNQIVLGTFVATFLYCLLILRSVRDLEGSAFVPNVSVTTAVLQAVGSLAVLIYFIDHISRALQGPQVVATVGGELIRAIATPFPADLGDGAPCDADDGRPAHPAEGKVVLAIENGYLQAIDEVGLLDAARSRDALIRLQCRPGDYIMQDSPLLRVEPAERCDETMQSKLVGCFYLGRQRTAEQDVEYSIRQLVEIGVRALSPGINDPFTAMNCIDWLGAGIAAVARHGLPTARRCDGEGRTRLIARISTFNGLVDAAFNQIRQFGADSVSVSVRLLEVFADTGRQLTTTAQREALAHHAEMTYQQACRKVQEPSDLADIRLRYEAAMAVLNSPSTAEAGGRSATAGPIGRGQ